MTTILITCGYNLNSENFESLEALQESIKEAIELTMFFWTNDDLAVETVPSPSTATGYFAFDEGNLNLDLLRVQGDLSDAMCQWGLPVEFLYIERQAEG